jgi:flagellar hook-basal body protein
MTMDSGFYAACAGLRARSQALEIVANNLANLNTTGYRAHETTFRSLLATNASTNANALNRAVNDFGVLGGTRVDLHAGNLESTGNALNFALEGDGFFTIQHQGQPFYTRDGNFRVSPSGQLITSEGDFVLGEQADLSSQRAGSDGRRRHAFGRWRGSRQAATGRLRAGRYPQRRRVLDVCSG